MVWHRPSTPAGLLARSSIGPVRKSFQVDLHDEGRYFKASPLVVAGPQFQEAMDLPPSVAPDSLVLPLCTGVSEMALVDAVVVPRSVLWLPATVITPLASTVTPLTYLEVCVSQALGSKADTSACEAVVTVSVTAVLQLLAAKIISETLVRTV